MVMMRMLKNYLKADRIEYNEVKCVKYPLGFRICVSGGFGVSVFFFVNLP